MAVGDCVVKRGENLGPHRSVRFWSEDSAKWNFGDALTRVFQERLFYDFDVFNSEFRLIGSTIFDGMVPVQRDCLSFDLPEWDGRQLCKIVFWGCGIRGPNGLAETSFSEIDILAVRGPMSASELRLGSDAPIGDPGLLLPALYYAKMKDHLRGKSVCIPHYNDNRPDVELLKLSGCDVILRPNIRPTVGAIYDFIDSIASADFVLSAALHGAITAVAYDKPFAYWDNGYTDVAIKYEDFAKSVAMPAVFAKTAQEGRTLYNEQTRPNLSIPSLWPLIAHAPFLLRPDGVLRVLKHELNRVEVEQWGETIDRFLRLLNDQAEHFARIEGQIRRFSVASFEEQNKRLMQAEAVSDALRSELEERGQELAASKAAVGSLTAEISDLSQTLESKVSGLTVDVQTLQDRIRHLDDELAASLVALSARAQEVKMLTHRTSAAEAKEAALNECLNEAMTVTDRMGAEMETLMERICSINAELVTAGAARDHLTAENERLSKEAGAARDHLIAENERLSKEATRHLQEVSKLRSMVGEAEWVRTGVVALISATEVRIKKSRRPGARLLSRANREAAALDADAREIEMFLTSIDAASVGVPQAGRRERILKYLMGVSDHIPDFPLLRNIEYRDLHPDVAEAGVNPFLHYLRHGRAEKRDIHPLLPTAPYEQSYPESSAISSCPAEHFLKWGFIKNCIVHPLFDGADYLNRYPDVKDAGINPLVHFLNHPLCTGHWLFDPDFYLKKNPDVAAHGRNPLTHYLIHGWREGRNPHTFFDTKLYLSLNTDVVGINPLVHFAAVGVKEHRRTCAQFDPRYYLSIYPDIDPTKEIPLRHFIEHGLREARLGVEPVKFSTAISRRATPATVRKPSAQPVVTMIDAFFPRPDQDSGSLDQINFAAIFRELGFDVHFVSVVEFPTGGFGDAAYAIRQLENLGVRCITNADYATIEEYLFLNNEAISLCFCSRVHFGGQYVDAARALCPNAKTVFNTVDLHHLREEREARLKADEVLFASAAQVKIDELRIVAVSDATIVVSTHEREVLAASGFSEGIYVVPLIRNFAGAKTSPYAERSGVAFVGGFAHQPNVDAVEYFLSEVWPLVHRANPDITFRVIGSNLPRTLSDRQVEGVTFVGYVEDLEVELSRAIATVAPLRYGAGAKGKLVSSLGYGTPAVVSAIAAEGMGLEHGHNVIIAETPESYVSSILDLHRDEVLWTRLSRGGLELIRRDYSPERGKKLFRALLSDLSVPLPDNSSVTQAGQARAY